MPLQASRNYFVRPQDVPAYSPANHTGTVNRRLIGPETVGAEHLEVLLGVLEKGGAELPHAHPGMEQARYMLAGRARAEIGGQSREIGPGERWFRRSKPRRGSLRAEDGQSAGGGPAPAGGAVRCAVSRPWPLRQSRRPECWPAPSRGAGFLRPPP